jgi:hypothetical protein
MFNGLPPIPAAMVKEDGTSLKLNHGTATTLDLRFVFRVSSFRTKIVIGMKSESHRCVLDYGL